MFTRIEASRIKQEFWTTFGRYMSPVPSAAGLKINWVNYHTGIKEVYFRMNADTKSATISISMEHRNPDTQKAYFDKFNTFKSLLHQTLQESWTWQLHTMLEGKLVSRIAKQLDKVSVLNKNDWPDLITFFKPRIIALDRFWADAKYSFDGG
jgi:hypothetical protein